MALTEKDMTAFKRKYHKAVREGVYVFVWREHEFLTTYAKYVIEAYNLQHNIKSRT